MGSHRALTLQREDRGAPPDSPSSGATVPGSDYRHGVKRSPFGRKSLATTTWIQATGSLGAHLAVFEALPATPVQVVLHRQ